MIIKKRKRRLWLIPLFCILAAAFLFYGPFDAFRRIWIQTAMYSSRYQFLAAMLYPRAYIDKVISSHFPSEQTERELPLPRFSDAVQFAEIKGNYFRGYIIKLEDPRRLHLVPSDNTRGKALEYICAEEGALGGVNGGGYRDHNNRGFPWGLLIAEGVTVHSCEEHGEHSVGGLTRENKLVVGRVKNDELPGLDYRWAFEFGPILIVNGEKTALSAYSGGLAPRTAIGQTTEGHILLAVVDGRRVSSIGATHEDMQRILYDNGAVNAIELDGGSSSCMFYRGTLVNRPSEGGEARLLPNALIFR